MIVAPADAAAWASEPTSGATQRTDRAAKARERFVAAASAVADALADSEYLVGERFGVADILAATALSIPERAGFPEDVSQDLKAYVARLKERSAYQRARKRETGATTAR